MSRNDDPSAAGRCVGDWHDELSAHCQDMFRSLPRSDQRRASEVYVSGLLRCPGKKSIRQIAREVPAGYSDQSLQQFVNQSMWNPDPVRQRLASWVADRAMPTAWVVDEVAFHKNGRHSAGVERQYVRAHGRLSNCQLGVFVALADESSSIPVTWRLALPRSWDSDEPRRIKARVPDAERHQKYWRYQVDALDDLSGDWGVPLAPVVLDLRQSPSFSEIATELEDRGLEFLMRVNSTVPIRFHPGRPQPGRRSTVNRATPSPVAGTLADLGAALSALPRQTISWRDPTDGCELRAQFTCASVHSVLPSAGSGHNPPAPQLLLLEWGLGKCTPRAFWLSNIVDREIGDLVALTRLAGRTSVDVAEMTDRFGLCDYEGRSFLGWHHHVTLASVAYGFYTKNPCSTGVPNLKKQPLTEGVRIS